MYDYIIYIYHFQSRSRNIHKINLYIEKKTIRMKLTNLIFDITFLSFQFLCIHHLTNHLFIIYHCRILS